MKAESSNLIVFFIILILALLTTGLAAVEL
jgi:hypothetical protein